VLAEFIQFPQAGVLGAETGQSAATLRAQDTDLATGQPRYPYPGAADILIVREMVTELPVHTYSRSDTGQCHHRS
jgi:hypothetical protein